MNRLVHFKVVGGVSVGDGPGFATPVFQNNRSNGIWVQDIRVDDVINSFLNVPEEGNRGVWYISSDLIRIIGDEAAYMYRDISRNIFVNTKEKLKDFLYEEYRKATDFTYLRRSIARFVDDKALLKEASDQVVARQEDYRKSIRTKISFWHEYQSYSLPRPYIRSATFNSVYHLVVEKRSVFLLSRRGGGKTTLLYMLYDALRGEKRRSMVVELFYHQDSDAPAEIKIKRASSRYKEIISEKELFFEAEKNTIIIIDDFDIWGNKTITLLRDLSRFASCIVVAGSSAASADLFASLVPGSAIVEVGVPSVDEIIETIRRNFETSGHGALDDLAAYQAAHLLQGLNFREIMEVFQRLPSSTYGETELKAAYWIRLDDLVPPIVWDSAKGSDLETKKAVVSLLDLAAGLISNLYLGDKANKEALMRLGSAGVLRTKDDRSAPTFVNRLMRDWWRERRQTILARS